MTQATTVTMGMDLGDRSSTFFRIDDTTGEILGEGQVKTNREDMRSFLEELSRLRLVIETGPQSSWISHLGEELGHEVIVAHASELRMIYASKRKSDQRDAQMLARVGRLDPELLHPVQHRSVAAQRDLTLLRARDVLVRARTMLVLHVRGTLKIFGAAVPKCSTPSFARKVVEYVPRELHGALDGVLEVIDTQTERIRAMDREIERLCRERYPEAQRLRQVAGVGALTALAFVLTIDDPSRFKRSRDVGGYLGLVPRRDQSGEIDKQLRITKAGDRFVRRLLVGAAHYVLGPFGPDTTLRRWGLRYAATGGRIAKKRAVVAVARKLAVLLHALWSSGADYEPLRGAAETSAAA